MIDEMSCVHILANDLNVVLFISQAGMNWAETTFTFKGTMFSVSRLLGCFLPTPTIAGIAFSFCLL